MNETVNKPMSVARHEFIQKLFDDVNNCQLPLFVIEPILQDLLDVVKTAMQKQYEAERAQYEQMLLQQAENDKKMN